MFGGNRETQQVEKYLFRSFITVYASPDITGMIKL
jgi:hypothetical protein